MVDGFKIGTAAASLEASYEFYFGERKCEPEERLNQCDCCGKMKYGCVDLWVSYVGDTHACPECRGDEEL